jgi:hypothetical protein
MSNGNGGNPKPIPWRTYYALMLVILALASVYAARSFDIYTFNEVTRDSIINLLMPLFVLAVFLERAQEVFISAWRDLGASALEQDVTNWRQAAKDAKDTRGTQDDKDASEGLKNAREKLSEWKAKTKRYSFLVGLAGGVLISIAGIRVMNPLVSWDAEIVGAQGALFDVLDIFITGGLLGGGADGIHKLMSLILDQIDVTREKIQAARPPAP